MTAVAPLNLAISFEDRTVEDENFAARASSIISLAAWRISTGSWGGANRANFASTSSSVVEIVEPSRWLLGSARLEGPRARK